MKLLEGRKILACVLIKELFLGRYSHFVTLISVLVLGPDVGSD